MATFTAGQIAHFIQRPDERLGSAVARFRNWAKEGIIEAVGEKHPGTGRKKHYSASALLEAVLIQALTDALGAPAVSLRGPVRKIVRNELLRESQVIVLSGRGPASTIKAVRLSKLKSHISRSPARIHTVVNLREIFKRLPYDQYLLEVHDQQMQRLEEMIRRT
jgi:hypothetical protein